MRWLFALNGANYSGGPACSPADVGELLSALREWRAVFADKKHFKWGFHTLKPEFAEQERALEQKIGQLRTTLHSTCAQRVRQ